MKHLPQVLPGKYNAGGKALSEGRAYGAKEFKKLRMPIYSRSLCHLSSQNEHLKWR